MVYIAIDLDLTCRQLWKVVKRAMIGLARTGSHGGDSSGDYIIAFSTEKRDVNPLYLESFKEITKRYAELTMAQAPKTSEGWLNPVCRAVVETNEESIINILSKAEITIGRNRKYPLWYTTGQSTGDDGEIPKRLTSFHL